MGRLRMFNHRLRIRLVGLAGPYLDGCGFTSPYEPSAIFINHRVREKQFSFEVFQRFIIKSELTSKSPIGHTSTLFEEVDNLVECLVEVHLTHPPLLPARLPSQVARMSSPYRGTCQWLWTVQ